jgi:histidinol dehydrogenase
LIRIIPASESGPLLDRKTTRLAEAEEVVKPILDDVRKRGDQAVAEYMARFEPAWNHRRPARGSFVVATDLLADAAGEVEAEFRDAVEAAAANIESFARLQMPQEFRTELAPGHVVGQIIRPLETVACYVPGGRYPLPSTVLMTAIPARVAGVRDVWVATPRYNRETCAAAHLAGVTRVAEIGGAQGIAAFAFGTESIPRADRIVGPGNIYVTAAKKLLAGEVGIDFIAGPTEVLIIANEGDPRWIAADMLAQAEHDPDAAAYLLTRSITLAEQVAAELDQQLATLSTAETASKAIEANSAIILVDSDEQAIELANQVAPEHLCLHDSALLGKVQNAGSVFLGPFSPEAAGDYCTGPNHVLPTAGAARLHGGLSVMDYLKVITIQEMSPEALARISGPATTLARAEGLEAHARSVEVRAADASPATEASNA